MLIVMQSAFYANIFRVSNDDWFDRFELYSDSLIYGKIMKTKSDMKSDEAKFLGRYSDGTQVNEKETVYFTEEIFLSNEDVSDYEYIVYTAQVGMQGVFYSTIARCVPSVDNATLLSILKVIASLLMALAMLAILMWVYYEFGIFSTIFTLFGILLMPWLTVMASSLYWFFVLAYLPFIVVLYYLMHTRERHNYKGLIICTLVFIAVFIRTLCGYEYISVILIAMVTPYVYYAYKDKWTFKEFFKRVFVISTSSLLAVAASLAYTFTKLNRYLTKDIHLAYDEILKRIAIRTGLGASNYDIDSIPFITESLEMKLPEVFRIYLFEGNGIIASLPAFSVLIVCMAVYTIFLVAKKTYPKHINDKKIRKINALSLMTVLSFIAPFSWMILARGHSVIHTHINYVLWSLPFAILSLSFVAATIECVIKANKSHKNSTA